MSVSKFHTHVISPRLDEDVIFQLDDIVFSSFIVDSSNLNIGRAMRHQVRPQKVGTWFEYTEERDKRLGLLGKHCLDILGLEEPDPVTQDLRSQINMVLLHEPKPIKEVLDLYENALVAGFALSNEEERAIQNASGVKNLFVFRHGEKNQFAFPLDVINWRRICQYLVSMSTFSGYLTTKNYKSVVAEAVRNDMLYGMGCGVNGYYKIQQHILETGNVDDLFRFTKTKRSKIPLWGRVINMNKPEYPLLEKPIACSGKCPKGCINYNSDVKSRFKKAYEAILPKKAPSK